MTNKLERLPDDVQADLIAAYEAVKATRRLQWTDPNFKAMWDIWHKWKLGDRQSWSCASCARLVYQRVGWMIDRLNEIE
jgi:hypothetical protein